MEALSVLIKPASSLCNMRCRYCFYADVSEHRLVRSYGVMTEEVAETLIKRVAEVGAQRVTFAFQGGEPTLSGLPFFRFFVKRAGALLPGATIAYSLQTNGLLLDDEFCAFLSENCFLVGLSLDGYRDIHDFNRLDSTGKGTFSSVLEAAARLKRHGVDFNLLTVLTGPLAKRAEKLWQFYQKNGFEFVQIIPCLEPLEEGERQNYSLTPRAFASFLKDLFGLWAKAVLDGRYISIRLFDNIVRQAFGYAPEMCGMRGFCSPQFVVEADGSVYPCDFYVLDEHACGNLKENTLEEMLAHPNMTRFLAYELPAPCKGCPFASFCGGHCKRYRSFFFSEAGYCPHRDFLASCRADITRVGRYVFGGRS